MNETNDRTVRYRGRALRNSITHRFPALSSQPGDERPRQTSPCLALSSSCLPPRLCFSPFAVAREEAGQVKPIPGRLIDDFGRVHAREAIASHKIESVSLSCVHYGTRGAGLSSDTQRPEEDGGESTFRRGRMSHYGEVVAHIEPQMTRKTVPRKREDVSRSEHIVPCSAFCRKNCPRLGRLTIGNASAAARRFRAWLLSAVNSASLSPPLLPNPLSYVARRGENFRMTDFCGGCRSSVFGAVKIVQVQISEVTGEGIVLIACLRAQSSQDLCL